MELCGMALGRPAIFAFPAPAPWPGNGEGTPIERRAISDCDDWMTLDITSTFDSSAWQLARKIHRDPPPQGGRATL